MFQALFAVLPVFLIIGAGVLLRSRDVLPENAGPVLGIYVLKLALPLLILHLLAGASLKDLGHWAFWGGILGSQFVMYCLGYVADRVFCRRGVGPGVIAGLSCSACNAAFVGLPIVSNLFPGNASAMLIAGLCTLTPNLVMIIGQSRLDALAGSLAWNGGNPLKFVGKLLRVFIIGNPILLSTLAGIGLSASGLGLWAPIDRAVSLVGYTAAPCMLLALGLDLRQKLMVATRQAHGHAMLRLSWFILWQPRKVRLIRPRLAQAGSKLAPSWPRTADSWTAATHAGMRVFFTNLSTLARMYAFDLDCTGYRRAFEIQQLAQAFVLRGGDDILLLLEHPPTVTLGKNSGQENLPPNLAAMWGTPVDVVHSTRGGNITCHFPGQLVAYPIVNLKKRTGGVRAYVNDVEETAIRTVRHFGIEAARRAGFPGVWVGNSKIASLGIAVQRHVTLHGLAMNVNRDLSLFNIITPCGLDGVTATSVQREQTGPPACMAEVKSRFLMAFCQVFEQAQPPLQTAGHCEALLAVQA